MVALCVGRPGVQQGCAAGGRCSFSQRKNERLIESHWRRVVAEIGLPLGVRWRVAA